MKSRLKVQRTGNIPKWLEIWVHFLALLKLFETVFKLFFRFGNIIANVVCLNTHVIPVLLPHTLYKLKVMFKKGKGIFCFSCSKQAAFYRSWESLYCYWVCPLLLSLWYNCDFKGSCSHPQCDKVHLREEKQATLKINVISQVFLLSLCST